MRKKLGAMVLACVMAVSMMTAAAPVMAEESAERETLTIGYSYLHLDTAQTIWWETQEKLMEEYNADDSNPYYLEWYFTNAEGDVTTQISDVESLIVRNPNVIMIKPVDSDGSVPAFEACKAAGIPVVNDGFTINTDQVDANLIVMDHYVIGEKQANWFLNWLDENPDETLNYCYMQSEVSNNDMVVRRNGFVETMEAAAEGDYKGRINMLAEQAAGYDAQEGANIAEDWLLAFPEMNAIVSPYDETAVAAAQVCNTQGRDVLICGVDGIESAIRAIDEGIMSFSASINWAVAAEYSLKLAIDVASGGDYEFDTNIAEYTITIVDSSNVADYMAAL